MNEAEKDQLLRQGLSYQASLTGYAYTITKNWSMAQDAFQEAIISMHHRIDTIKPNTALAWLKTVTRNKAVDLIRKNETQSAVKEKLNTVIHQEFDRQLNDQYAESKAMEKSALMKCMERLKQDARNLLLQFYFHKKSCATLAPAFNRSENALRLMLSRSRKSLKKCISKQLSQPQ